MHITVKQKLAAEDVVSRGMNPRDDSVSAGHTCPHDDC